MYMYIYIYIYMYMYQANPSCPCYNLYTEYGSVGVQ